MITFEKIKCSDICGLNEYSVIDNKKLLMEIFRSCYFNGDLRASWIGPGIPKTNLNFDLDTTPVLPITYWTTWALEHWAMYYGFIHDFQDFTYPFEIFDVGCGTGYNTINLTKIFPNAKITAIDLDQETINFAIKYNSHKNIKYMTKDATLFEDSNKYDIIFCMEILEHIPANTHYNMLDKCLWLLKDKDSKLYLTTPNEPNGIDSTNPHGHVGLLNKERALDFFFKYECNMVYNKCGFFNNRTLKTCDVNKYIIEDDIIQYFDEEDDINRSHFKIVLRKT